MKTCVQCHIGFEVTDQDRAFYDSVSPVIGGKKFAIPEPTHCPDCRQQRRLAQCNEFNLYRGTCLLCGKSALSQFPPDSKQPQYCRECWHSDRWDPCEYGVDVDFSKPLFPQIHALRRRVPALMLNQQGTLINSDYIHYAGSSKNCYLIMHADYCEDCYYGYGFKNNKFCVDGFYNLHSEYCYDCVDVHRSYGLVASQDCMNCHSGAFLRDCIGCKDCFLCVGLRQKQYCFENRQLSKADYEKKMAEIDLGSHQQYQTYKTRLRDLEKHHTFKEYQGHNLQNCSGDHLVNCKDTQDSFDCEDVENGRFCYQIVLGGKNIYDVYQFGTDLQASYESSIVGEQAYHVLFSQEPNISCSDIFYCFYLEAARNCFGSAHLHHKQYCILNKQYSKAEYEALVPRLIEHMKQTGEWGEFFPVADSFFGYNKTTAQLYYPLTKDAALARGWQWDDYEPPVPAAKTIPASRLPDAIDDIPDDVLNWAILCEVTGRPFKVTAAELKFYRNRRLPLPRRHPDQRFLDRFRLRNPRRFFERSCDLCHTPMRTAYSPDRPEKVYCEACYLKTVY